MQYTVEYRTNRYISVTVEADSPEEARRKADAGIQWGYEPTSEEFEIHRSGSKDWLVNDVAEHDS
jgi:hypothetical protein